MKRIFTLLLLSFSLVAFTSLSDMGEVLGALRSGNAVKLASYFDNTVDLTLPAKASSYSKTQAQIILKDFFDTNKVTGFKIIHQGESNGSKFCIGTLTTSNGSYRTTIYLRSKSTGETVQEIRFEL